MCPVLPCIKALLRSSPETVKTAVAQVKDASAVVVSVIDFLACFFTDASVDFTWFCYCSSSQLLGHVKLREAKRGTLTQGAQARTAGPRLGLCLVRGPAYRQRPLLSALV